MRQSPLWIVLLLSALSCTPIGLGGKKSSPSPRDAAVESEQKPVPAGGGGVNEPVHDDATKGNATTTAGDQIADLPPKGGDGKATSDGRDDKTTTDGDGKATSDGGEGKTTSGGDGKTTTDGDGKATSDGGDGKTTTSGTGTDGGGSTDGGRKPVIVSDDTIFVEPVDIGTSIVTEEISGPNMAMSITGLRKDRNVGRLNLQITKPNGRTQTLIWPGKDQKLEVSGICTAKKVTIKIAVNGREPSNQHCFIGKQQDVNTLTVGFEDDCRAGKLNYNRIDDSIATFYCPHTEITIQDLHVDSAIDMNEWLH